MAFSIRALGIVLLVLQPVVFGQVPSSSFVNYEVAPIHAMDLSPGGNLLAIVNTADMRVEIFSLSQGVPVPEAIVAVGLEPVSVRFRSDDELWVVNNLSDSVSVIDIPERQVIATLKTLDDPYDVVFAGSPERAFISCGLPSMLQVFDPANLLSAPVATPLQGNTPRALAVSADGSTVHVAFFHSGNRSTIISGGMSSPGSAIVTFPPDVVSNNSGPHGGVNPPPNSGSVFSPTRNVAAGTPPRVSMIVKQDAQGVWRDDTGADWTNWISGANASASGRHPGWQLIDHDLAVVDANTMQVQYVGGMMNLCMALDVNPVSGLVAVVGTEAHNEIRFEPNIQGRFIDVVAGLADPASLQVLGVVDLNAELTSQYNGGAPLPLSERTKALGDPRSIKWTSDGQFAFVAGMGSNNVVIYDETGQRVGQPIALREGPVGLAIDEAREQIYVLNRFDGSISVVDLVTQAETSLVRYFDPTPTVIRAGRKHLYDTHESSAIGQIACASCHIDSRMDRLSWDLGNPAGDTVLLSQRDLNRSNTFQIPIGFGINVVIGDDGNLSDFHPMKGPMLTQTLQDIIGKEPFHWRGDRFGLEEFNGAFIDLQGRGSQLTGTEMAAFEAFLATIHYPPNPHRNLNNTLPTSLNLVGHYATGRFSLPAGAPLPAGNAVAGLAQYRIVDGAPVVGMRLDRGIFGCVSCHTLPTGGSTDRRWQSNNWVSIPRGANNENHLLVMNVSDVTPDPVQHTLKVPHMRNLHERVGFNMHSGNPSTAGFGYMHDGSGPSIADFIANPAFNFQSDQQIANVVALLLSWSGSDFQLHGAPPPSVTNVALEPPGVFSQDSHAAVGQQETIYDPGQSTTRLNELISVVGASTRIQLVAKRSGIGAPRGYLMVSGGSFTADFPGEQATLSQLTGSTGSGVSVTFTVVPAGTGQRLGIDRDMDSYLDYQEIVNCTDPNDPSSFGEAQCASVQAGYVVHNGWSGVGSNVDSVKQVYLQTGTPTTLTYNNLINSLHGINGIALDVDSLADPDNISTADFVFQVSPQGLFDEPANAPVNWAAAAAPSSISVAQGSPDRISIAWNDHAIENRWLRITILATARTGLASEEVFYIGHLRGETTGVDGGSYSVAFADIQEIRNAIGNSVNSSSIMDIDKNGAVAFADIGSMRPNIGTQLTNITVPPPSE